MNRITAIAIYLALTAVTGMSAYAQPASTVDARQQSQPAGQPAIHCTHQDGGTRGLQPCRVQRADEPLRIGSNVSRQEFECRLSGNCGVDDRARVTG